MKITPLFYSEIQSQTKQDLSEKKFEASLRRDEYYQNHKPQWEQSQLHFDEDSKQTDTNIPSHVPCPISSQVPQTQNIQNQLQPKSLNLPLPLITDITLEEPFEQVYQQSVPSFTKQKDQSMLLIVQNQLHYILNEDFKQSGSIKIKQSFNQSPLKNHHVFKQDKNVAIALRDINLTRQQRRELIMRIQQLLSEQGLHLVKLTINGEAQ